MQDKEAYKTGYENPTVGGNVIGGNNNADGLPLKSNPSCDGFAAPSEYNDPSTGKLKSSSLSLASLKKAIQLVVAILGTSIVGFGLVFSSGSSFKAAIDVIAVFSDGVACSVDFDGTEEEIIESDFELQCISRHTTRYSQSCKIEDASEQKEYVFEGLEPNTEYVIKLYKDGKFVCRKTFKTSKSNQP